VPASTRRGSRGSCVTGIYHTTRWLPPNSCPEPSFSRAVPNCQPATRCLQHPRGSGKAPSTQLSLCGNLAQRAARALRVLWLQHTKCTPHTHACSLKDHQSSTLVRHAGVVSSGPYDRRPERQKAESLDSTCPHARAGTPGRAAGICIGQPDMAADIEGPRSSDCETHTTEAHVQG
jgi:hypothetical protein